MAEVLLAIGASGASTSSSSLKSFVFASKSSMMLSITNVQGANCAGDSASM